jgi:hypothetical protein
MSGAGSSNCMKSCGFWFRPVPVQILSICRDKKRSTADRSAVALLEHAVPSFLMLLISLLLLLLLLYYILVEPGQLSGIALGYGLDDRGFESRQGLGIFLYTVSRPALGPT